MQHPHRLWYREDYFDCQTSQSMHNNPEDTYTSKNDMCGYWFEEIKTNNPGGDVPVLNPEEFEEKINILTSLLNATGFTSSWNSIVGNLGTFKGLA